MELFKVKKDCAFDVVIVGACFCDLQTFVHGFPMPGDTIYGRKFQMDFGGKGANACTMAAKLGGKTALVSTIGDDVFGRETIDNLHKFGIDTDCVKVITDSATGITNCIVDETGEPLFIGIVGASKSLTPEHLNEATCIKNCKVMLTNREISQATCLEALKLSKLSGAITIYNPAPSIGELGDDFFAKYTDILMLNLAEAAAMTKTKVTNRTEAENACNWFHNKGVPCVVMTMGGDGAIVSMLHLDDNKASPETERKLFHVPTRKAKVVDTTGAGDALAGTFAFFLASYPHLSLVEIVTRSVAIATYTVEIEGVQRSYPTRDSLPEELFHS